MTTPAGRISVTRAHAPCTPTTATRPAPRLWPALGIIWQPTFLIGDDLRAGRCSAILPGFHLPDIDILAVYPSRRHLSAKVRVMIDFLAAQFGGTAPWDRP